MPDAYQTEMMVRAKVPDGLDESWMRGAACAEEGPSIFYMNDDASIASAKAICATCSVRSECLEYSIAGLHPLGTWGGLSERERSALKKNRQRRKRRDAMLSDRNFGSV